jgi:SAM-dependent methyltransferase
MYTTRHFPATLRSASGQAFVRRAAAHYGARAAKRAVASVVKPGSVRWRSATTVSAAYDTERGYTLERVAALDFEELVFGSADRFDAVSDSDFILLDDRVVWDLTRKSRRFLVEEMHRRFAALATPGSTIGEFGSGNGRNIFYLKTRMPDCEFVGLDLSPVSVDLARQLAVQHRCPARFEVANVCEPLPDAAPKTVDIAFSSHALEMMPRTFPGAIDNMLRIATRHVLFFEPVPELWPWTARGAASHWRAYVMDRLRGFMPVLRQRAAAAGWRVVEARRLRTSTNPINETVFVQVSKN